MNSFCVRAVAILGVMTGLLSASDNREMEARVRELWKQEDFAGLEKVAGECRDKKLELFDPFPPIVDFYGAMRGNGVQSDEEAAEWAERLDRWQKQIPDSVTARVALADFLVTDAWRARGTGWISTVTPEKRILFEKRLSRAREVLDDPKSSISVDPCLAGLRVIVGMGLDRDWTGMMSAYWDAQKHWPLFYPVYDNVARALLPRWRGVPGDTARFAQAAADRLPPDQGDGLYAMLATMVLEAEGVDRFPEAGFDHVRFLRGLDILATHIEESYRLFARQRAASVEALLGDPAKARERIFACGPDVIPAAYGGDDGVTAAWEQCGAMEEIREVAKWEGLGQLREAEEWCRSRYPTEPNPWIDSFGLRNGMRNLWPENYATPRVGLPVESANLNQVFEMAYRSICAGDLGAAERYAKVFDQARPHNLTGKYILTLVAVLQNAPENFTKEKERFLVMDTDRRAYQVAQDYVAGRMTLERALETMPRDSYWIQACAMMGTCALGDGKKEEAETIFRKVHRRFPFSQAAAFSESLLWGALARKFPDQLFAPTTLSANHGPTNH